MVTEAAEVPKLLSTDLAGGKIHPILKTRYVLRKSTDFTAIKSSICGDYQCCTEASEVNQAIQFGLLDYMVWKKHP